MVNAEKQTVARVCDRRHETQVKGFSANDLHECLGRLGKRAFVATVEKSINDINYGSNILEG